MTKNYFGWLELIKGFRSDVPTLMEEYHRVVEPLMADVSTYNSIIVQRKFHLMRMDEFDDRVDLSSVPYVMEMAEKVKPLLDFNSITYRIVMPNTCYNWHVDLGKNCIHIPLTTNEGCWFVFENRCFRMPADGTVYIVNNERPHTFMNSGTTERLHLTFETLFNS
jgi:hypothetical protein